jgi:hypothetical protein
MTGFVVGLVVAATAAAGVPAPLTVAEASDFTRTSLHADVIALVHRVAAESPAVNLATLAHTAEGREIPLVILSRDGIRSPAELRASGLPAVLIMANIHAGEVEGKEASQMLIREVGAGRLGGLLENQVILVIPILNADGNERLGNHRRDHGPDLAGVRHNSQYLDLNRDFVKLESPEIRALVRLLREWDPVLLVDMHTTNGSHHRDPVTYATGSNPNCSAELMEYMWSRLFPAVGGALRDSHDWGNVPYGNFLDAEHPEKGWHNPSVEARFGTNYVSLRNRLTILDETFYFADFRTRVLASFDFIRTILEYTNANAGEIAALVQRVDQETRRTFRNHPLALAWSLEPLMDVTIRGFEHQRTPTTAQQRAEYPWLGEYRVVPTETPQDYTIPYLARAVPARTVELPAGYALLPGFGEAASNLLAHGITVERLATPVTVVAQHYVIEKTEVASLLFQGHAMITVTGRYETRETELPVGTLWVDMEQPLARLIGVLMEPESSDSLAAWGFFNRSLVRQWSAAPGVYPVLRLPRRPAVPLVVLTNVER